MKQTKIVLVILILVVCFSGLNAQSKHNKYSVSVFGGLFVPVGNASTVYNTGGNFGLGLNYKMNKNIDLYIEGGYNFIKYIYTSNFDGNPSIIDFKAGVKYSFESSNKYRTFLEGGAGLYMFSLPSFKTTTTVTHIHIDPKSGDTTYTYDPVTTTTASQTTAKIGIFGGIGESINVAKNVDLFLKTDYNIVFTENYSTLYLGVQAGAKFGF